MNKFTCPPVLALSMQSRSLIAKNQSLTAWFIPTTNQLDQAWSVTILVLVSWFFQGSFTPVWVLIMYYTGALISLELAPIQLYRGKKNPKFTSSNAIFLLLPPLYGPLDSLHTKKLISVIIYDNCTLIHHKQLMHIINFNNFLYCKHLNLHSSQAVQWILAC